MKVMLIVHSDISPIDIASYLYLLSNVALIQLVGIFKKKGLRRKSKVCTLNAQIKPSGFKISHSKVFSSAQISYSCS